MMYLVTVKLPKNPKHNPHNKVTGACPVMPNATCTDMTGEHHTFLFESDRDVEYVKLNWNDYHITRVETDGRL
jgi:hypothetical protein